MWGAEDSTDRRRPAGCRTGVPPAPPWRRDAATAAGREAGGPLPCRVPPRYSIDALISRASASIFPSFVANVSIFSDSSA